MQVACLGAWDGETDELWPKMHLMNTKKMLLVHPCKSMSNDVSVCLQGKDRDPGKKISHLPTSHYLAYAIFPYSGGKLFILDSYWDALILSVSLLYTVGCIGWTSFVY